MKKSRVDLCVELEASLLSYLEDSNHNGWLGTIVHIYITQQMYNSVYRNFLAGLPPSILAYNIYRKVLRFSGAHAALPSSLPTSISVGSWPYHFVLELIMVMADFLNYVLDFGCGLYKLVSTGLNFSLGVFQCLIFFVCFKHCGFIFSCFVLVYSEEALC